MIDAPSPPKSVNAHFGSVGTRRTRMLAQRQCKNWTSAALYRLCGFSCKGETRRCSGIRRSAVPNHIAKSCRLAGHWQNHWRISHVVRCQKYRQCAQATSDRSHPRSSGRRRTRRLGGNHWCYGAASGERSPARAARTPRALATSHPVAGRVTVVPSRPARCRTPAPAGRDGVSSRGPSDRPRRLPRPKSRSRARPGAPIVVCACAAHSSIAAPARSDSRREQNGRGGARGCYLVTPMRFSSVLPILGFHDRLVEERCKVIHVIVCPENN